jgi:hypothetical protein|tara:strand:- start:3690 stop:3920 length:231 start_codon:yes stop_codon:yes gene_type:complete
MSPETALLLDAWDTVKSFIPAKERLHVAEELVRTFEDNVSISDAEDNLNEFDTVMKAALVSHFDIGLDEEEDEDWD